MRFQIRSGILFYLVICHTFAIVTFLYGFLPVSLKSNVQFADNRQKSLDDDLAGAMFHEKKLNAPKYEQLIMIVIDALRADFILEESFRHFMPYLDKLHKDNLACSYLAQAHTPTVTLPRIKALVTGTIPGFSDIIFNLGSSEIVEDSLIHQLHTSGHKIIFYGDDTWLRLYPDKFLPRSEGTTSFFVNDFTEVDENVTRHLDFELNQTDWTVMILHYLGLDHIGHISGPKSHLVPLKLKEMDDVIRKIHEATKNTKTAIVVCGDHGMSDSGSHGGSSKSEIEIPLVFIVNDCITDKDIHLQIDMAPTVSLLMGVPIPSNSLGSLLPGILHTMPSNERLYAAFVNARTIAKQYDGSTSTVSPPMSYQHALKLYQDWLSGSGTATEATIMQLFFKASAEMSSHLIESLVRFDHYVMIIGILISLQVLFVTITECQSLVKNVSIRLVFSSSLFTIIMIASILVHVTVCVSIENNSSVCINGKNSTFYTLGRCVVILASWAINWLLILSRSATFSYRSNIPELFLVFATIFHCFSLTSSSFVEEEHQTYYFFVSTLLLLILSSVTKNRSTVLRVIGAMGLLRISRSWNQTGDKWINEPDIEEWLNNPENKHYLTLSSLLGAVGIFGWIRYTRDLSQFQEITVVVGLFGILAHRAALGSFSVPYPISMGLAEAMVVYTSLIVTSIYAWNSPTWPSVKVTMCVVLMSLLKKPHNLVLTWMQLIQYSLIEPVLAAQLRPLHYGLAHYCLGMSWYFQQGNGNNLARVDLQSGYVGLPSYSPAIVGILLTFATYSGPVLALLLGLQNSRNKHKMVCGFLFSRTIIVSVYLIIVTLMRHHLFIWTVFSPKLLYEGALSLTFSIIILLHLY